MNAPEDRAFARFARTGDPAALGEVYDRVASELFNVAVHLARDPAEAEDLLQATFVTAIERAGSYDATKRVLPWLAGILANQARAARRRARAASPAPGEDLAASSTVGEEAAHGELVERLDETLSKVPEAFRPVLILRLKHALSAVEIAHALQRPPGTVRSQLARGLELVRRHLPAGLAGAAVLSLARPARGLSAVREAVLSQASLAAGGGVSLSLFAGGLLVKKVLVAAACVLVLASAWWVGTAGGPSASAPVGPRVEPTAPARPGPLVEVLESAPEVVRAEVEGPVAVAPVPVEDPPRLGTVRLRVRGPEGEPAAGALALLQVGGAEQLRRPVQRRVSGADGHALFEDVAPGTHRVRLLLGGGATVTVVPGGTSELELSLLAGYAARVQVVDERDEPLAGAEVWLSERSEADLGHVVGVTGPSGTFTLEGLNDYHYVGARLPGRAMSFVQHLRGVPGETYALRVRLEAEGGHLVGIVFGPDGERVVDAVVSIRPAHDPEPARLESGLVMPGPPPSLEATDAEGAFAFASAQLGEQLLQVQAVGYAARALEVELFAGVRRRVDVHLEPEALVAGSARDAGGEPIAGVRVHTVGRAGAAGSTAYSDGSGAFLLQGLAAGAVTLEATHPEHGRQRREFLLAAGTRSDWDPMLVPSPSIHGRVLDAEGAPLAHWPLTAMDESLGRAGARSTTTDAEGRFSIADLEERAYALWVHAPRAWREFPRHVERGVRPGPRELTIRLSDGEAERGTLVGEVLGPDGEPGRDVQVTLWHVEERMWRSFPIDPGSGELEIPDVPPGHVQVEVRGEHDPWYRVGEVRVDAGRVTELGTIQLEAGGRLVARLAGGSPEALASLELVLADERNGEAGTVIREGRELRSSVLAPGTYSLGLRGDRVRSQTLEFQVVAGASTELDVVLEPAFLREVVFLLPEGAARERRMWAAAVDDGGVQVWLAPVVTADADGRFRVRVSVPAGEYELVGRTPSGRGARVPLVVGAAPVEAPLEVLLVEGS